MTLYAIYRTILFTRLIASVWLGLLAFDASRLAGFASLYAWLRQSPAAPRRSTASIDEVVWSIEEACVWYVKRAACLQRSVVATWLLRRNGIAAELVIGYRPLPFESHAWVEVGGHVVNDRPQYQRAFTVLDRL